MKCSNVLLLCQEFNYIIIKGLDYKILDTCYQTQNLASVTYRN